MSGAEAKASPNRATIVVGGRPETERATHGQVEAGVRPRGGPNRPRLKTGRMTCGSEGKANQARRYLVLSEIYLGIASSKLRSGRRALLGRGGLPAYQLQANSEDHYVYLGSQSVGDKLHGQKGNSPDRQLRPQNDC